MSLQNDVAVLARGCDFYKQRYEEVNTQLAKATAAIEQMRVTGRAQGYVTEQDVVQSPVFQQFVQKVADNANFTDEERSQLNQQSDTLLKSLVKVSGELETYKQANANLNNENNDLKNQIQAMLSNRITEQQSIFADALKNKDIAFETRSALEKAGQLVADLQAENARLQEYVKYKEMYEKEHEELVNMGNQLDEIMRGSKSASFVDDADDIF